MRRIPPSGRRFFRGSRPVHGRDKRLPISIVIPSRAESAVRNLLLAWGTASAVPFFCAQTRAVFPNRDTVSRIFDVAPMLAGVEPIQLARGDQRLGGYYQWVLDDVRQTVEWFCSH